MMRRTAPLSIGLALCVGSARAQRPDGRAAQAIFDEAKQLVAAGDYRAACPKFAESQRIDPAPGTLFHLSDCHERIGRLATAWRGFSALADAASSEGRTEHEALARRRAAALEPRLPRLLVLVPVATTRVTVTHEREIVALEPGQPVPVDLGTYTVAASGPGRAPWQTVVHVDTAGRTVTVMIPEPGPSTSGAAAPRPDARSAGTTRRVLGIAALGAGVVAVGVGGYFGLHAVALEDEASPHCDGSRCNQKGFALRESAIDAANTSTALFVAGASIAALGAVLWITAPSVGAASGAGATRTAGVGVGADRLVVRAAF